MRNVDFKYYSKDFNKNVVRIPLTLYVPPNGERKDEWIFGTSITKEVGDRAQELIEADFYFEAEVLRNTQQVSFTLSHADHPYGDLQIIIVPAHLGVDPELLPTKVAEMIMYKTVEEREEELRLAIQHELVLSEMVDDGAFRG